MSSPPTVSVCIPVYNPRRYLHFAIASVLTQSFGDFELIIVDDCSTESGEAVIAEFDDSRLSYRRNAQNLGLAGNWNRGLSLARGEYVAIFHQDDVMHSDNLLRKVSILDANPSVGYVYSNIQQINDTGEVIGGHWVPQPERDAILPGLAIFEMVAAMDNPVSCPTVVARAECYNRVGKFNARLGYALDMAMWLRIASKYDVAYLAQPLVAQRVHSQQETARFAGTGKDYLDFLRALDSVLSHHLGPSHARYVNNAYQSLSRRAVRMGRWKLRQGKVSHGLRYFSVAAQALYRVSLYPGIQE